MFVLGLTGSIGMGKSTTARLFQEQGVPVHDSDACVRALYQGQALPLLEQAFPEAIENNTINRAKVSQIVLNDHNRLVQLEGILHPLVIAEKRAFLEKQAYQNTKIAVLDVPLLFETGGERFCDGLLVVSAPKDVQRARVLARQGMTESRFQTILARQMPDDDKRCKAHFVINTGLGLDFARREVQALLKALAGC